MLKNRNTAGLFRLVMLLSLLLSLGLTTLDNRVAQAAPISPDAVSETLTAKAVSQDMLEPNLSLDGQQLLEAHYRPGPRPGGLHNLLMAGMQVTVFVPYGFSHQQSLQVLVAMHGMYSNGLVFSQGLLGFAQQNRLVVIAPTFNYNPDYKSSSIVAAEDSIFTRKLNQMTSEFSKRMHLRLKSKLLLYGFSRGAQLAHHYAMLYPQTTLGVVAISAGTYTLPLATFKDAPLNFPFGIENMKAYGPAAFDWTTFANVPFWIAVGGNDTDPSVVSRAWDAYEGTNRLERAQSFYDALKQKAMHAQLTIFPHTGHQVTDAMNLAATNFFKSLLT